jgi:hypothetical protein
MSWTVEGGGMEEVMDPADSIYCFSNKMIIYVYIDKHIFIRFYCTYH